MRSILIDCDPGHDDALAIILAYAHPEVVKILGITTVGGNQTIEKVTENAKRVLEYIGADIPLVPGSSEPLVKPLLPQPEAHGESGMDGPVFPKQSNYPLAGTNAIEFLYQKIQSTSEKVTLVALGPLTNVAKLLLAHPELKEKIEQISLMGGGLNNGNVTPAAEFNIYVDPEAAQIVFQSGIPIVMAGLDVGEESTITLAEVESLKGKGKVATLAYELLKFYGESGKQFGFTDSPIYDAVSVAQLIKPELFSGEYYTIDIVLDGVAQGMTLADRRRKPEERNKIYVLMKVNRQGFSDLMLDAFERLDR